MSALLPSGLVTLISPCPSFPVYKRGPGAQALPEDYVKCHLVGTSPSGLFVSAAVAFPFFVQTLTSVSKLFELKA